MPSRRPVLRYVKYISDTKTPDNRPVFGLTSVQVWYTVKKYGRMINVDIHPHTLRYSFAIHLVSSGPGSIYGVCNSCWGIRT